MNARLSVLLLASLIAAVVVAVRISDRRSHRGSVRAPTAEQTAFEIADGDGGGSTLTEIREPEQPAPNAPKNKGGKKDAPKVIHQPAQPKSGQSITITVDLRGQSGRLEPVLEYQVVDPGRYIALADAAYEKRWETAPMNDSGTASDQVAGDSTFTAQLPGSLQRHRRLVRYRVRNQPRGELVAPAETDRQRNLAYFVYDGVPPWKGAINPAANDAKLREPVTYSSAVLQRVPVYHLISSKQAVERATWSGGWQGDRHEYKYTGTLVYDGVVYDHVGFRARGGSWRHAMGKNMWKINFLPGHRFEARDHYGNRYNSKWDKLNLGACIQQGDYGMRGEQGMFEAVGFRLFNLAGVEASRTHWVHFRVIDEAEETPSSQYSGDFWGLYLAVENLDEHFLKEHSLPPGNLYKMEFGAKIAFNGDPTVTDQSDVAAFSQMSMRRQQSAAWWAENLDLPRYFNYRAILECIHHYDIDAGKNYFYYRNPESRKWVVLPWDIDLSWGDHMYGGGHEPFYRAGILSRAPYKQQYQARLAEIRDLLFNPEEIGRLIDEHAAMISDPAGAPSLVDADRAKWDYHPVMVSRYVMREKAGQGRFYFEDPHNRFPEMVKYMKNYAAKRARWVDSRLLGDYKPPPAPQVATPGSTKLTAGALRFNAQAQADATPQAFRWRVAEITDPKSPAFDPRIPWKYEIQALWEQENPQPEAVVPASVFVPGHTYRVRARLREDSGQWSRWSAPVEFTVPTG